MHAKRSSSNNLHHRENADRGHQAETQKRSWQPKLTAQSLRSNCVHNLGVRVLALVVCAVLCLAAPFTLTAQEPGESISRSPWEYLKERKISAETRFRFEAFERDGAPFTAPAYAPTLKIT